MAVMTDSFTPWLAQAQIRADALTTEQHALLQAAYRFRQAQGTDYYSTRLLGHFLLHCASGLKVAQIARLLGCSRPTASRQQNLSAKEAIQQAHHRMDGRPYGKLLPRYAGPIAAYCFLHPQATRADLIDFIDATWGVRVSRIALYHFLKKYGLDQRLEAGGAGATAPGATAPGATAPAVSSATSLPLAELPPRGVPELPAGRPLPVPAPPFSPHGPSMPAPSCSCRTR